MFKKNINNYLRNDGHLIITTFDAQKVRELLKGKDKYTQEYTDENGKNKTLFEIVEKVILRPTDLEIYDFKVQYMNYAF